MYKKMLKKINIRYKICYNINYLTIDFIKLNSKIKLVKPQILCVHIILKQKNEDLIKIHRR